MHNSVWLSLYDNCKRIDFNEGRCYQLFGIGITKHGRVKFFQFSFLQLLSEHTTLIEHTRFDPTTIKIENLAFANWDTALI